MLVKVLGTIDILAGAILLFGELIGLSKVFFLLFGVILLIKSFLGFPKDLASWIDFSCSIILILNMFVSFPAWIELILGLLIIQKGIFSFL